MNWFYKIDNEVKGPISVDALTKLYKSGEIDATTNVKREDDQGWSTLNECFDLESSKSSKADPADTGEGGGKVIENRVCAHSGEVWPEHMMVKVTDDQWVSKQHLTEFQTSFQTKEMAKRRTKSLGIALVVLLVVGGVGAGGFGWWKQKKAEEEAAAAAAAAKTNAISAALGSLGGPMGAPGVPGQTQAAAMIQDAAMEKAQMSSTTSKLLETFGVPPMAAPTPVPARTAGGTLQPAANWSQTATKQWPSILLKSRVMLNKLGVFAGGRGFLVETDTGQIIGVSSISFLTPAGDSKKLVETVKDLNDTLQSWAMFPITDSTRSVQFSKLHGDASRVIQNINLLAGNVLLSGNSMSRGELTSEALLLQHNAPALGEMTYVLVGSDRSSGANQTVQPAAVIEHSKDAESFSLGMRKSSASVIGCPVISVHGLLTGIITERERTDDPALNSAGVLKYKVLPAARIADLL